MHIDHVTKEDLREIRAILEDILKLVKGNLKDPKETEWLKSVDVRRLLSI